MKSLTTGGSTNTLGALKRALGDSQVHAVYLLTDGRPDQVSHIFRTIITVEAPNLKIGVNRWV